MGLVALGAEDVPDDADILVVVAGLVLDGGKGAEEEARDIGDGGGASRGDAVLGEEGQEPGEDPVDFGGGGELEEIADEVGGGSKGGVLARLKPKVTTNNSRF